VRGDRERLLEGMVRVAAGKGYEAATVAEVAEFAGLTRADFDHHFEGKEECFLVAYEAAIDVLVANVSTAVQSAAGAPWVDRVAVALRALLALLAAEADIARMGIVEVSAIGEDARIRYRGALDRFVPFLEEGRVASEQGERLPAETARFAIGGGTSMIFDEIRAGRGAELEAILPALLFAVTMPYLGVEAAEAEMRRVAASS
jgi:AcrR family transcriptional regulator